MRIPFTKMQGAGNDFVLLNEIDTCYHLRPEQYRWLADRHFGIGADQILSVRAATSAQADFSYLIHNADGQQVEHCGNGARCFMVFVRRQGLSDKNLLTVQTVNRLLQLRHEADGFITVNMQAPDFDPAQLPFVSAGLQPQPFGNWALWPLPLEAPGSVAPAALVSMGNPHAVLLAADVEQAPVAVQGPLLQRLPAFPAGVNVGFMQIEGRQQIRLRVFERGVGETLSCGTGACAAAVCGMRLGLLDATVKVLTRGGLLRVSWAGGAQPVLLSGPAAVVFDGEIEVPD